MQNSVEYLYVDVRADRVLDTQAIYVSISPTNDPGIWQTATWVGDAGKFRAARILLDGTLPTDLYYVFARLVDLSEQPIFAVGTLRVT